jgi:membrane protein DedA with SNARE-associated domain
MDLVVPGEVGMVIAGAAAVTGGHPVAPMIAAAALGAIAGDTLQLRRRPTVGALIIARSR